MYPILLGQNCYWGMTEAALADYLGLSRTTVHSKLHRGTWTLPECQQLSALYQKPIEWLFAQESQINTAMGFGTPELTPKWQQQAQPVSGVPDIIQAADASAGGLLRTAARNLGLAG